MSTNQASTISAPTATDVLRYRYHWGTNLGSIFVLEKWLSGSMFPANSTGNHELAAVTASVQEIGLEAAKAKWEAHWKEAVSEDEFDWLVKEARCTSIRLPIGFFTLGEEWCKGTKFESVAGVYTNAWTAVKEFVERARGRGIGVLLDFHFVYGGANGDAHGSATGRADLWGNATNLERMKEALGWIAKEAKDMDGVIGLQLVNEAVRNAEGMYQFYEDVITEIARWDETLPIYISNAWDLSTALDWTIERRALGVPKNPVVVDTHRYYTFSDEDRSQSPQQIIGRIGSELEELDGREGSVADKKDAQLIVGEWSCVLDTKTWARVTPEERVGLVTQFGRVQSQRWQQRAGGSFFWTFKMDWMDGGEWGFAEQSKKHNIVPPEYLALPAQEVRDRISAAEANRGALAQTARQSHEEYWNRTAPGNSFDYQLYSDGWNIGFSDAQTFFGMRSQAGLGASVAAEGGDKIGLLEIWVEKRLFESGQTGDSVWIWEQGFRAGIGGSNQLVGM
ncbi:related to Putative glucan 1,3-beta-glucosidase [Rhynchosporium graminicola]|uniref:Related to Putative glucan 1,3-beta-glucosidase n=1 Tax=Rhynchosporium graminicola TaxID=2792576 RepID=A0A1E1K1G2_9HELO|nr:related to Putative glucan 1,3-beta-glucosidase [Rhynchosporium commune]